MNTNNNPLISVIVPIYNVELWLPKCIDSLLVQTYKNIEIILSEDGSPDGCAKISDQYALKDTRIRVLHKLNGGLSDARNAAIDIARGEYLTFVDSDDFVTPDYVETLIMLCLKYNCNISVADWYIFPIGATPKIPKRSIKEIFFNKKDALEDMFNQRHFDVSACVKLYHRSLFENIRYPKGTLFEDLQTTFKLILASDTGVAYSNKQIYYYMFRPGSIEGSSFSEKKMDSAINVFDVMKSYEPELRFVNQALHSKLAAFCFHLVLKMPNGYSRGKVLFDYIKQVRFGVILNNKARFKTRLACLISYLGFGTTKKLFSLVDRRK